MANSFVDSAVQGVKDTATGNFQKLPSDFSSSMAWMDPSKLGHSNAQVTPPTAPPPGAAPHVAAPTTGPAGTTIASTTGPAAVAVTKTGDATSYNPDAVAAQNKLMTQLAGQANGTAPSVSGMQLQQGQQNNLAATMAQLASTRGSANPLMQRQALQAGSDSQAATNQQAAINRLGEQQSAQGQLANLSTNAAGQGLQARAQDIGVNAQNAANQQQAGIAGYQGNLQTNLAQGNINAANASQLFGAQQAAGATNAAQDAQYNNLLSQYAGMDQAAQGVNAGTTTGNALGSAKVLGGVFSGAGSVLGSKAAAAAYSGGEVPMAEGGRVKGRATVVGDSPQNDTIHVLLSPGEVVLPRSVVHAPDPVSAFKAFMATIHHKPITPNNGSMQQVLMARMAERK